MDFDNPSRIFFPFPFFLPPGRHRNLVVMWTLPLHFPIMRHNLHPSTAFPGHISFAGAHWCKGTTSRLVLRDLVLSACVMSSCSLVVLSLLVALDSLLLLPIGNSSEVNHPSMTVVWNNKAVNVTVARETVIHRTHLLVRYEPLWGVSFIFCK